MSEEESVILRLAQGQPLNRLVSSVLLFAWCWVTANNDLGEGMLAL